jgi:osomolarity two-component system response regulator SSK1
MPLSATEVDETLRASQISMTEESGRISPGETLIRTVEGSSGPLLCMVEIVHTFTANSKPSLASTPRADIPIPVETPGVPDRQEPDFDGLLCRRIIKHVNAVLRNGSTETEPSYFAPGKSGVTRTYELSVLLARGEPINESAGLTAAEQAARQPFPSLKLDREPTLLELSTFASTLRGKKVELHASLMSIFARHLTSYLAAWGMDVSHVPIEIESANGSKNANAGETDSQAAEGSSVTQGSLLGPNLKVGEPTATGEKFILIDDDVSVLRSQLLKLKSEAASFGSRPRQIKRPTLAGRTRSSPHVRTLKGEGLSLGPALPTAVIHFTSLANYNHVRDVVASILSANWYQPPEIMVIPKPVGPRRFLTALHTVVQRPLVDPFFTPIATSPRSPGGGYFPPFAVKTPSGMPMESPLRVSHGTDYLGQDFSTLASYRRAAQVSPSYEGIPGRQHDGSVAISTPGGEYLATPAGSYFSRPVPHGAVSAAQGVFVRNSSGHHMGVFFDPSKPESKDNRRTASNASGENLRRKPSGANRSSTASDGAKSPSVPPSPARRLSGISTASSLEDRTSRRGSTLQPVTDEAEPSEEEAAAPSARSHVRISNGRRRVSGESIGSNRERSRTLTEAERPALRSFNSNTSQTDGLTAEQVAEMVSSPAVQDISERATRRLMAVEATRAARAKAEAKIAEAQPPVKSGKGAAAKGATVVPPINVLIVEGKFTMISACSTTAGLEIIDCEIQTQTTQSIKTFCPCSCGNDESSIKWLTTVKKRWRNGRLEYFI